MTKEQKIKTVEDLTAVLSENHTIYLTDLSGLNAQQTSDFRRDCFNAQIKLQVVKNTLLKKAMEAVGNKSFDPFYDLLKGSTSLITTEVNNAPAKTIKTFRNKAKHQKPLLKGAYTEESFYIGDQNLESLINIKSREELTGEIIGLLQSPLKRVVLALQSSGQKVSCLLETLLKI
ncbi:MAG: 50S ribosomal protein L10 [Flavobacteriales bacterium AspAUS03]